MRKYTMFRETTSDSCEQDVCWGGPLRGGGAIASQTSPRRGRGTTELKATLRNRRRGQSIPG